MTLSLKEIQAPVESEMKEFEVKFRNSMRSKVLLLDKITNYIVKSKGKQIRPLFVFLSAQLAGKINEKTHRGAALIELLHTATLVHDDVVDDADYRRSFFSINALWKNKIAVLVGDYLLSRGLLLAVDNGDFDSLQIVSQAVREMSEGELLQMEKSRLLDITEDVYYEIIRQKTATLISACCGVGVASVNASKEQIEMMKLFGEKVGIAFQMKDDLFDYGDAEVGKPLGIDIKEKKMTLPLIYALKNADNSKKNYIINLIKNESHKNHKVKEVIEYVKKSGGIEYTVQAMHKIYHEALDILKNFPESPARQSLGNLVTFTIERNK